MRVAPAGPILAALFASCSSTIDRGRMQQELATATPEFSSQTVEEIEKIQPQLSVPFRLAVAPPIWRKELHWSREERKELESWGPELKAIGLVSEFILIPSVTYEISAANQRGWFEQLRTAAARHHADAVLVVRDVDDTSSWVNVLSVLDLTIVACWFVPGHHVEAVSLMQALVLDNRNEYLYASAEGEGSVVKVLPFAYVDAEEYRQEARLAALKDLKEGLLARARAEMAKLHP